MKIEDILELPDGETVEIEGLVFKKEYRTFKMSNKRYLRLFIRDKTGWIEGIFSDAEQEMKQILEGQAYVFRAIVKSGPKGKFLHILEALPKASGFSIYDYMPMDKEVINNMWYELRGYIRNISDPYLNALLNFIFNDEKLAQKFRTYPADILGHQNYLGGLLEHTLKVLRLALTLVASERRVDKNVIIAGAILHDIGKIREYRLTPFSLTAEGKLLGHIVLGYQIVKEKIEKLRILKEPFPVRLEKELLHIILSHHGPIYLGSPVAPSTPEAAVIYYADTMDTLIWQVFHQKRWAESFLISSFQYKAPDEITREILEYGQEEEI